MVANRALHIERQKFYKQLLKLTLRRLSSKASCHYAQGYKKTLC